MRRPRSDRPGSWHHVTNRALARRAMFESRRDVRYFLAALARAVRRGELEVHAFCVLTTHYHLLVRSPAGQLSRAMRRIQTSYVRWFNRGRRRDGALVRGRFWSRAVDSLRYREVLVRYIDANPVAAGLCRDAREYTWCSAHMFAGRTPKWLSRTWICALAGPAGYPAAGACERFSQLEEVVQARLRCDRGDGAFDDLLDAAPARIRERLRRKARLADGGQAEPCVSGRGLHDEVAMRARAGSWAVKFGSRTICGWQVLEAGLRRDWAGESFSSIADQLQVSLPTASRLHGRHRLLLIEDAGYADRAASVLRSQLLALST